MAVHPAEPLALASRLHEKAIAHNAAGRPRAASHDVRRALQVLGVDPADALNGSTGDALDAPRVRLVAHLLITLAKSEVEVAGIDRGLQVLDAALSWGHHEEASPVRVALQNQRGVVLWRGGRLREALDEFALADSWFPSAAVVEVCRILLNRGAVLTELGMVARARRDLALCVQLASSNGLVVEHRAAVHNLGYVEFIAGNLPEALRLMDEGMKLDSEMQVQIALLDRARVLIAAGLFADADETLAAATAVAKKERLWQDVSEVELARAECALLDGEYDAARRLAGNARTRFKRRGNDRWRRMAELLLLQGDLEVGRPGLRLAPHALRLANEFTSDGVALQARTARLIAAECYLRAGRVELAEAAANEADDIRAGDPISARLHARLVRAQVARATGNTAGSRREIRVGLVELGRYQAQFGGIDMQTASAIHGRKLAELNLEIALDSGRPLDVLAAVEDGRALSSRLVSVRAPEDETAADLLGELRQVSEELRTIEADPTAVAQSISLRKRAREIQKLLRERSWQFEGAGEARKRATPAAIGDELSNQGAVLACYFETEGQLHGVIWGDRVGRVASLGLAGPVGEQIKRIRADLDVMANGLLSGVMLRAVSGSLTRSLERLDDALVRPLDLGDERLVLVPSGLLATVPWTLLPSLSGRPVVVAPSATAWLNASTAPPTHGGDVLAIAGPDLKRAAEEVKAVGRRWRTARVVHGKKATRDELAHGITSARIVHVAAHGEHQMNNPLFSSLRLADAPLYAWELDQHAEAAEHVILSACELGQATIRPGDEALGLTSVLLHLGTRSVISGVARVHDDVAAEVMTRYHRDLANGMDSAQALAEACAAEKDIPAPFVCFGSAWSAG